MATSSDSRPARLRDELSTVVRQARQVCRVVPARHRGALAAAAAVMALASACQIAIPLLLGRLIDHLQHGWEQGLPPRALSALAAGNLLLLGAAYLCRESLHVGRRYLVERTCMRIEKDTIVRLVSHLLKMDLGALAQQKVGALHGRIYRSVDGLVRFLRLSFLDFIPALLTGALALAATAGKQPLLGLLMLGVIPVSLALTRWQLLSQKGVRLSLLRTRETMDGTIVEQLGGLDHIRAANTHEQEVQRVEHAAETRRAQELRHHVQMSLFGSGKAITEAFFHLLVLAGAVALAASGRITFGDVWTFSLLFLNVMTPLSEIHRILDEGHESSLQVAQLLDLLGEPLDVSFTPADCREPCLQAGEPAFVVEGLRVEHRTAEGHRPALRGVSLSIAHGETIGVAGRSGCGKTTWLRALLRLVHPCGGRAWLGGVPLEHLSRETIGRLIGYVGQTPFLFAGTVAENIAYGSGPGPDQAIEQAARMAGIHDEILALPWGYRTPLAERGQNLSGGQRQRIALARVFLKGPPILILDEGTSALDTISERAIQQALEAARQDRTVILVAHRLSTLRHTDRVVVFDAGRIVEVGTYQELEQRGGLFSELVRSAGAGEGHRPLPPQLRRSA
jgi:ATP-binding cassette subfamily B protein